MNIKQIRNNLERSKGKLQQIQQTIEDKKQSIKQNESLLEKAEKARLIIQIVAQETQEQLEYRLNELVSLAMIAVFGKDAYSLNMQFQIKRGKTEAEPFFERNGKKRKPGYGTGFGPMDVASLVLRPTLWSLEDPKKRPIMIYDEPLRHLNDPTGNLHKKAAEMIRELSSKLALQIIIVTQNDDLCEAGDRIFHIDQDKGKSFIKKIDDRSL